MVGPHFICIGSQRSGTGYLFDVLRGHSDVWMPPLKELHYFDRPVDERKAEVARLLGEKLRHNTETQAEDDAAQDPTSAPRKVKRIYRRLGPSLEASPGHLQRDLSFLSQIREAALLNDTDLDRYRALFAHADNLITGDITPAYAALPEAQIAQIAKALPETKILYIVREPISRLWSAARMKTRGGRSLIAKDISRFIEFCNDPKVRAISFQSQAYEMWKRHYGDNLYVFFFDDLRDSPEQFHKSICDIIGIDGNPAKTQHDLGYNRKGRPAWPMPPEFKEVTIDYLSGEHDRLAELFGGHALRWREKVKQEALS